MLEFYLLDESMSFTESVIKLLSEAKASKQTISYHLDLMSKISTVAMQFEKALFYHRQFDSPTHILEQIECLYQLGKYEEATEIMDKINPKFIKDLQPRYLNIILKVAITSRYSDILSLCEQQIQVTNSKEKVDGVDDCIASMYLIFNSILTKQVNSSKLKFIHQKIDALSNQGVPIQHIAYIYHSFLDVLTRCKLYYEAKDILQEYKNILLKYDEEGIGFKQSVERWKNVLLTELVL